MPGLNPKLRALDNMKIKNQFGKMLFAVWDCDNKKWYSYQLKDMVQKLSFTKFIQFDPKLAINEHGKDYMNNKFLKIVEKEKPDYIFLWPMHEEFYLRTLADIRKVSPKTITLCYNGDDDYKFKNYTMHFFPFIDYFLTTQPQFLKEYKKYNVPAFFSCGADLEKFKPLKYKKEIDVSFVGTPKTDRLEFIKYLIKNRINLRVYGMGWDKYPEIKDHYDGFVADENFANLINRSKINICLSKNYVGGTHILERFFNINACRGFCLTEYAEGYFPSFKEGEDIVTFKNKEELLKKIQYYLSHDNEREKVAERAYKKTIKSFSTLESLKKAMNFIEQDKKNKFGKTLPKNNKRATYLQKKDLFMGKDRLSKLIKSFDYICFKNKNSENLEFKEYLQMQALERTQLPICCCDNYLYSRLIKDYASLCLYYAFDLKDKEYFLSNLDISQLMVEKEYFLTHLDKFIALFNGEPATFINKKNTNFLSIPLVRLKKLTKLPLNNVDHVLFTYYDRELLILKNNKKIYRTTYLPKLLFYSTLVNPAVIKLILKYTIKRARNNKLSVIAEFINKRLFKIV